MSRLFLYLTLLAALPARADLTHFEARQVHPIAITPDGRTLMAVNSPDASLSIFDISNAARSAPLLIGEVPVGLEPVSVKARTNGEAWVVNSVSDTVTVISMIDGSILATLSVPDEPADVHFAAGKAFVTCSANRVVSVFDAVTRAPLGSIPLQGVSPWSMTSSADGSRLYVTFLLSGNGTTILPRTKAPAQPAPTNPALPAAPQTALIVPATDPRINYTVLDHDIAEINTATLQVVGYRGGLGTHLFDAAVRPGTDELWTANSDSMNLVRFEPQLRGNFMRHRLSSVRLSTPGEAPVIRDLNPAIDYTVLPNAEGIATALAQPTALAFSPAGDQVWVAAFNSDRVAAVDTATGEVTTRIDLRTPPATGPEGMRGPRGLAMTPDGGRLYALNKLSNTISVVDTAAGSLLCEVPAGSNDPTPDFIRQGRGFLFDARLSGNGTTSCASCHLDSDRDGLAWDLGDPGGEMVTVKGAFLSAHFSALEDRVLHPMKGPLTTQTLIGMAGNVTPITTPAQAVVTKFHWRGDKPSIQSFNPTFSNLLGGAQIPADRMDALATYLTALRLQPNPNRMPDRTLPATFQGGNPTKGRDMFNNHVKSHCMMCHALPAGTDQNIDRKIEVNGTQEMKNPPLRTVYQRFGIFNPVAGAESLAGFGLNSDGTGYELPKSHFYQLDNLNTTQELKDVAAFLLCFDTGTAPAVGRTALVTTANRGAAATTTEIALLEARAIAADCDLVARIDRQGQIRSYLFLTATATYQPDSSSSPPVTRAALLNSIAAGETLTFMGVLPGDGARLGGDRNGDGLRDADEPRPGLGIQASAGQIELKWPGPSGQWFPETSTSPAGPWAPFTAPSSFESGGERAQAPLSKAPQRFFRLRSTR